MASGKPQELTRSQPDIKDDPVGVMWALLCRAWGQQLPEPNGSPMRRQSHTCMTPHPNTEMQGPQVWTLDLCSLESEPGI